MFYGCMNTPIPKEFKSDNFLKDLDFLKSSFNVFFNLVDNELTKHMLDFTLKDTYAFKDSNYFSTGCDLYNGNVFYTNVSVDTYTNYFKNTTFIREDTTIDTHDCATVAETATVEQTFDTNNVAANILAVLFNNFITNPSKFTTKRVNFIATSSPKTEVVDYEHTYQVLNFFKKFRENTNDLTDYLLSRDFEFKRSKLGKQYKEQLESYSKYIDTDAYIEYLKRVFNYIE